jgi:hypothetical protein
VDWRLQLSTFPVCALHSLPGDPDLVVVWSSQHEAAFFDIDSGVFYGSLAVNATVRPGSNQWPRFVEALRAPNGAYFPLALAPEAHVFSTYDGRLRAYWDRGQVLILDMDGQPVPLARDGEAALSAVALDRELGTAAALSVDNRLHIYQQHVYVGSVEIETEPGLFRALLMPDAADSIRIVDTRRIQVLDFGGIRLHAQDAPSPVEAAAVSPNGQRLVIGCQAEAMIRVYDAALHLVRQGTVYDVWAQADPVQLWVDAPPPDAAFEAMCLTDEGRLTFVWGGVLCCVYLDALELVPHARTLF